MNVSFALPLQNETVPVKMLGDETCDKIGIESYQFITVDEAPSNIIEYHINNWDQFTVNVTSIVLDKES